MRLQKDIERHKWHVWNRFCDRVTHNKWFVNFIMLVIVLNTIWIGADLDWNHTADEISSTVFNATDNTTSVVRHQIGAGVSPEEFKILWTIGDNFFCVVFFIELVLRLFAHPSFIGMFVFHPIMWYWNILDSLLVAMLVFETWILPFTDLGASLSGFSTLRIARILRITRVFRMLPELLMMVKSLVAATRCVTSTVTLEVGLTYMFAVVLTSWGKSDAIKDFCSPDSICFDIYFGSIGASSLTLFQILCFDDAFMIIRPVMDEAWYIGLLLIVYIIIACFMVLNMLVGVICEIVSVTTMAEKETLMKEGVRDVFMSIDADHNGIVNRSEFDNWSKKISKLGIETSILENAFDILDNDGTGTLDLEEFIQGIFKMTRPPQSQDLLKLHQKFDRISSVLGVGSAVAFGSSGIPIAPEPMRPSSLGVEMMQKTKEKAETEAAARDNSRERDAAWQQQVDMVAQAQIQQVGMAQQLMLQQQHMAMLAQQQALAPRLADLQRSQQQGIQSPGMGLDGIRLGSLAPSSDPMWQQMQMHPGFPGAQFGMGGGDQRPQWSRSSSRDKLGGGGGRGYPPATPPLYGGGGMSNMPLPEHVQAMMLQQQALEMEAIRLANGGVGGGPFQGTYDSHESWSDASVPRAEDPRAPSSPSKPWTSI